MSSPDNERIDPVVVHTRREALWILAAFVVCLIWSVSWCYLAGYRAPDDGPLVTVLGMPSWVFWGVLVPWLAANAFTIWFCMFFMADDPLGESQEEADPGNAGADGPESVEEDRHA